MLDKEDCSKAIKKHQAGFGTVAKSVLEAGIHRIVDWEPLLTHNWRMSWVETFGKES
jgi:hypothetical protein